MTDLSNHKPETGAFFARDRLWHPPGLTPGYKTSVLRSPQKALLSLDGTISETTGPVFGHSILGELDNDLIDRQAFADLGGNLLDLAVLFGFQDVFHLHRLHRRQGLTFLHLVTDFDHDLGHQPRHRAEQEFRGVGRQFLQHQFRLFRLTRRAHMHLQIRPTQPQPEPARDFADLHHHRHTIDRQAGQRLARHPI